MTARSLFLLATAIFWNAVGYYAVRCERQCPPAAPAAAVGPAASTGSDSVKPTIPMSEVARHTTVDDCWIAINRKVYSVGPFMDIHPGDSNLMLDYCGKDGSKPYAVKDSGKDKGKPHTRRANEFLEEYYIGDLAGS